MRVTDEMVDAALAAWYPGEWPDDPVFREPQPVGLPGGANTFADYARRDMRRTLEAALAGSPAAALAEALREYRAAFANRGETTSLHSWHERLKVADQNAAQALAAWDAAQGGENKNVG